MLLESPVSSVLPIDGNDEAKTPSRESQWYRPDIGPRLKQAMKAVYENWIDITGNVLIRHLHSIVLCMLLPLLNFSSNFMLV